MDLPLTVVDAASTETYDVVLTADPTSTVAEVESALLSHTGSAAGFPQVRALPGVVLDAGGDGLFVRGARVDAAQRLADGALRPGDVVSLGGAGPSLVTDEAVIGSVEVRIVSGPAAGVVHRLGLGEFTVGSDAHADVRIADPAIAAVALILRVGANGISTRPPDVEQTDPLEPDAVLRLADSAITVGPILLPDAVLSPGADGTLSYNRPPRLLPAPTRKRIDTPTEPTAQARRALPIVAMVAPLLLGVVIAWVAKNPTFLLFALMGPIMAGGSVWSERREGKKSNRTRRKEYEAAKAAAEQELAEALVAEVARRRLEAPDAAALLLTATGPRRRLWERRRGDDDALLLRVGTGRQAADVELRAGISDPEPKRPDLDDVPVCVSLRDSAVVGVAGPMDHVRGLTRSLLAQVAVLHSPRDVSVVVLTDARSSADWSWVRWLPHCSPPEGVEATASIGNGVDSTPIRINELLAQVVARTRTAADARGRMQLDKLAAIVVLLDGARDLRALPGVPQILQDGPAVGVYALCLDSDERRLPEECQAVVALDPTGARATVRRSRGAVDVDVVPDLVTAAWAERTARALCPIRDVSAEEGEAALPGSLRLLDLLGLDQPSADGIRARWLLGGRTTSALIGASTEGPFSLDLRRDGPHALVAGTTGAGKSEFLQTVIAALAVANRPDSLTFVLVDYKGGSAFKDCARLPHTVGMVTDLDGHLTERALTSLSAELKRRERVLGAADAKDIEDYWRAFDAGAPGTEPLPLPRLVIVIDEFASMVEELPDFVRGLVGIAQRGRSLGVHLILATQRPSGVVSPEIRANTNLRVALRVTDTAESSDVIDAPDAARIARSTPGRGYIRTGHASLTAFQAARVGGRRPGSSTAVDDVRVVDVPWDRVGLPLPRRIALAAPDDDETDLHALVLAINAANEVEAIPDQLSPWLPALPDAVSLDDLPEPVPLHEGELAALPYGLEDLPAEQARRAAVLDLEHGSHLIIAGAPRSGRSTALRAIAGSLAQRYSADDVHLYGIDCGNGALLPLADLPHCGAVVTRHQVERGERLLTRLVAEVTRRQELLALKGFADVAEQRAAASTEDRLPYLVVLLDRWEGYLASFDELDGGRLTDELMRVLREGAGAGVRFVIAGDRSVLMGKVSNAVEDKLVLRLADRSDYTLAGLNPRTLPETPAPGRAFRGESGLEVQIAMLGDGTGASQNEAVRELAAQAAPATRHPFRVDVLPTLISYADATKLADAEHGRGLLRSPLRALVGVGGDELTTFSVDLELSPSFTIGGPPRSGRSTALMAMARGFLDARTPVVIFAPRPSPLRELAGAPGVVAVITTANPTELQVAEILNAAPSPLAVLVDDAELLHPSDAQPVLVHVIQTGRDETRCLVVAGTTDDLMEAFRGFTAEARKSRTGILLSPETHQQGELLGIRLPRSSPFRGPAGRGILIGGGEARLVQVPLIGPDSFG